jgi:asparagine synthase (glutamine-hydrolysing)
MMPGLVGYTCAETSKNHRPLVTMINSMGNFAVDEFYGQSLHIARLHLGLFNVEKQPLWNENGTLGITTYGKIYDYKQEMEKLKDLGHKFAYANNDAELILHAYEEFGNDVFPRLNGSYTFAIFDDDKRKLTIVTDRFGTRPMYYALKDGNLIYPKSLDEKVIVKFFRYGKLGILGDDTWFEGIQSIPSASFLEFHNGKTRIAQYWDIDYLADHAKNEEIFVRELLKKFRKAVNSRVFDNINFGVSLSGGLDSRAVSAAITNEKLAKVQAYTFGVESCNEFKVAKLVTRTMGLKNHYLIKLDPNDFIKYAKHVVYLTDGMDTIDVSFLPYVYEKFMKRSRK